MGRPARWAGTVGRHGGPARWLARRAGTVGRHVGPAWWAGTVGWHGGLARRANTLGPARLAPFGPCRPGLLQY